MKKLLFVACLALLACEGEGGGEADAGAGEAMISGADACYAYMIAVFPMAACCAEKYNIFWERRDFAASIAWRCDDWCGHDRMVSFDLIQDAIMDTTVEYGLGGEGECHYHSGPAWQELVDATGDCLPLIRPDQITEH